MRPLDLFFPDQRREVAPRRGLGDSEPSAEFLHRQVAVLPEQLGEPVAPGLNDVQRNFAANSRSRRRPPGVISRHWCEMGKSRAPMAERSRSLMIGFRHFENARVRPPGRKRGSVRLGVP